VDTRKENTPITLDEFIQKANKLRADRSLRHTLDEEGVANGV
jgi:hypothetical protein